LNADYVRTARAKGLTEVSVLWRHVLHNASVPIVTIIGLGVALLIGGVVVTESVYSIPGLGRLVVDAVLARDYLTIQAVVLLFSVVYVLINLIDELTYIILDTRISSCKLLSYYTVLCSSRIFVYNVLDHAPAHIYLD